MIWRDGRRRLGVVIGRRFVSEDVFFARTDVQSARRTAGTGIFLTGSTEGIPPTLTHHLERVGILHRQVVLLSVLTLDLPYVEPKRRLKVTELPQGFVRVVAHFGYQEEPNVPRLLEACAIHGLVVDFDRLTYFLGRDLIRLRRAHGPLSLPGRLFTFFARNAAPAVGYFGMPVEHLVEIGMQHEI